MEAQTQGGDPGTPTSSLARFLTCPPTCLCSGKGLGKRTEGTFSLQCVCSLAEVRSQPPPVPRRLLESHPAGEGPPPTALCPQGFQEHGSWLPPGKGVHAAQHLLSVTSAGHRAWSWEVHECPTWPASHSHLTEGKLRPRGRCRLLPPGKSQSPFRSSFILINVSEPLQSAESRYMGGLLVEFSPAKVRVHGLQG